jgi:hypothetical protein
MSRAGRATWPQEEPGDGEGLSACLTLTWGRRPGYIWIFLGGVRRAADMT